MSQSSQAMGCVTIETLPASPPLCPGVWNRPSMLGAGLFPAKPHLLLLGVTLIKPKSCTTTCFSDYRMPGPNTVQKELKQSVQYIFLERLVYYKM